jgi:hypothetical protein
MTVMFGRPVIPAVTLEKTRPHINPGTDMHRVTITEAWTIQIIEPVVQMSASINVTEAQIDIEGIVKTRRIVVIGTRVIRIVPIGIRRRRRNYINVGLRGRVLNTVIAVRDNLP